MATDRLASLPEHYERSLGVIGRGWSDEHEEHGVQVVTFEDQPEPGVRTFATLGLSQFVVALPHGRQIRQELLISANSGFAPSSVAALILSMAESVIRSRKALLRGEVVGPGNPVVKGSTLNALYVTNPSPFSNSLVEFDSGQIAMVFAYLIPITPGEASCIRQKGWRWFEDQLESENPEIWDLSRTNEITCEPDCR
jgi:antitoxin YqcF